MALPYVNVTIASPTNLKRKRRRKLLADSGALDTIVCKELLKAIGIRPYGTETFTLANGSTIRWKQEMLFYRLMGDRLPVLSSLERKEMAPSLALSLLSL